MVFAFLWLLQLGQGSSLLGPLIERTKLVIVFCVTILVLILLNANSNHGVVSTTLNVNLTLFVILLNEIWELYIYSVANIVIY
jgi:hypothetical protein